MVQTDMQFDRTFGSAELGLGKDTEAQIDGGRIERVEFVLESKAVTRCEPLALRKKLGEQRLLQ